MVKKKNPSKAGKGLLLGDNSPFKNIPVLGAILSNHELLQWCDKLGITICGVYSRNEYMPKQHSPCIINLDDFGNQGTHWVCCFPSLTFEGSLNYFDSFGMPYPEEYAKRAKKDNLQIIYNTSQYQELTSVLCGYYCLFVLHRAMVFNENYSDILKVFNENNQKYNENFIKNYFNNNNLKNF